jgi:hypothetical protein
VIHRTTSIPTFNEHLGGGKVGASSVAAKIETARSEGEDRQIVAHRFPRARIACLSLPAHSAMPLRVTKSSTSPRSADSLNLWYGISIAAHHRAVCHKQRLIVLL